MENNLTLCLLCSKWCARLLLPTSRALVQYPLDYMGVDPFSTCIVLVSQTWEGRGANPMSAHSNLSVSWTVRSLSGRWDPELATTQSQTLILRKPQETIKIMICRAPVRSLVGNVSWDGALVIYEVERTTSLIIFVG